ACVSSVPAPAPLSTYTLSLHDALPISRNVARVREDGFYVVEPTVGRPASRRDDSPGFGACGLGRQLVRTLTAILVSRRRFQSLEDRKSTRLNSSHSQISYAVFCLKKKK